jgi:hypothetical protein
MILVLMLQVLVNLLLIFIINIFYRFIIIVKLFLHGLDSIDRIMFLS